MRVIVVGGGLAGLVGALRLAQQGCAVTVLDAAREVGGKLALRAPGLEEFGADLELDVGAESMIARRPEAVRLVAELGLAEQLVHPGPARPLIASRGALYPLPAGTLMGVPVDRRSVANLRGLLTDAEVARVEAEPTVPVRPVDPALADVAVGGWVAHRFGRAVVDRLTEPLLGGVYAGHADELSMRMAVPQLWPRAAAAETVLDGPPLTPPPAPDAPPVFAGLRGGVGTLVRALLAALAAAGATVRTGVTVRALTPGPEGWALETGPAPAPEVLRADAVLLAVPAPAAAKLLAAAAPAAADELAGLRTASVAVISTLIPAAQLPGLSGSQAASGLLVPPVEERLIKAATFSSVKWPWLRDRLAAHELHAVRLSVGRVGEERSLQRGDPDLTAAALADLGDVLGVPAPEPVWSTVVRWGGSLPQYEPGHLARAAAVRAAVRAVPGLAVAGAALDGVGLPAVIGSAERAVTDLLATAGAGPVST
ncbi:protoporphyrinogen oxidase [Spongisporangium articulatum]|uniref:Coproporphyrinogen III oxidase n=1 Tax=Spongisporangium articulatum TaxID=3362603 RepID=A0ABW8AUD4_9ACTN